MTKGEIRMKKIIQEEKMAETNYNKERKIRDKYSIFAIRSICPKCGNNLKMPEEVVSWINGEFGALEFYIKCTCGFYYSTLNKEDEKKALNYFSH